MRHVNTVTGEIIDTKRFNRIQLLIEGEPKPVRRRSRGWDKWWTELYMHLGMILFIFGMAWLVISASTDKL